MRHARDDNEQQNCETTSHVSHCTDLDGSKTLPLFPISGGNAFVSCQLRHSPQYSRYGFDEIVYTVACIIFVMIQLAFDGRVI